MQEKHVRLGDLGGRGLVAHLSEVALVSVVLNSSTTELGVLEESDCGARANAKAGSLVIAAKVLKRSTILRELPNKTRELLLLEAKSDKRA